MTMTRSDAIPVMALSLDLILGDPPNRYHPVAWMGTAMARAGTHAPKEGHLAQFGYGAAVVMGGALAVAALGRLLEGVISHLPRPISWLAKAALLKATFSVRGLSIAAEGIHSALDCADLSEARRLVSWHLVSRDTSTLDGSQVAAATIESVAENASDGVVAPLVYYALGGLPAAFAYRFINTADSMWGYRDPAHEWLGKVPARLDDLANYLPARITAGLLVLASAIAGEDAGRAKQSETAADCCKDAWRIWRRDAGNTASPNAGHPMSAMAGALGVELEKVGHYRLGVGQRKPAPADITGAVRLMRVAAGLAVGAMMAMPLIARLLKGRDRP